MPLPIRLRPATDVDLETLVRFGAAMALETEHRRLDLTRLREGILNLLSDPHRGFFRMAECIRHESNHVVGQLMVTYEWSDWRNGQFWWIQSVYVDPTWRRQGIYQAMHETIRREAKLTPGVCGLRLYVERTNHAAQRAYTRAGMHRATYGVYEEDFVLPSSIEQEES
ncbi:hypothetical protein YTPLAS18_02140 [Nitrospira sp.]|nr:hypothetical protein YTPLAS18_02140 [Nitrospira sp.]